MQCESAHNVRDLWTARFHVAIIAQGILSGRDTPFQLPSTLETRWLLKPP